MKISILNYDERTVDIVVVDKAFVEDRFNGDVEEYLTSLDYPINRIEYMCGTDGINIIDNDDLLQIS